MSTTQKKTRSISILTLKPIDLRLACKNLANFDHHHPHKKLLNRSWHSKQANFGAHTVYFDPPHSKQVTFDTKTRTKSNSIPRKKNQVDFNASTEIKSIRSPLWLNQVNFDASTQKPIKLSIYTLHLRIFRLPRKNKINSDLYTEVKSISIPTVKSNRF